MAYGPKKDNPDRPRYSTGMTQAPAPQPNMGQGRPSPGGGSVMWWRLDCGDAGSVDGISDSDAPGGWTDGGTQSYGDTDCTTHHY